MTPLPLDKVGLGWRSHLSALWWLALLYRRPREACRALEGVPRWRGVWTAVVLYLHGLPWVIVTGAIGHLSVVGVLALAWEFELGGPERLIPHVWAIYTGTASGIAWGITWGTGLGIALGIAGAIALGIARGIALGIAGAIAVGIAGAIAVGTGTGMGAGIGYGIAIAITRGIAFGIAGGIAVGIGAGTARGIAFGIAAGIAAGIGAVIPEVSAFGIARGIPAGIAAGIATGIALAIGTTRVYYLASHLPFVWPSAKGHWYRWHPVAWDDMCSVPFPGLGRLLLACAEYDRAAGEAEIERLVSRYPSQRMNALRARTSLIAREAGREGNLAKLPTIVTELPDGTKGFLAETARVREMIAGISQLQARLDVAGRPIFRQPYAQSLRTEIESFRHQIAGFHEPLRTEFRAAAEQWLKVADRQLAEARAVVSRAPTPQVFRAGDPVDRAQEAFVPRDAVVGELERQIMLSTGCPGVVLYGRRRMGKSTVLRNVSGFLPPSVMVATLSMQNPAAFTSLEYFVESLAQEVGKALGQPGGARQTLHLPVLGTNDAVFGWGEPAGARQTPHDLPGFFRFLADTNEALGKDGKRLLVGLDEYENIDVKIGAGLFPEDLLATLRESIQTHRQLTWVFAGGHEIGELKHAPWASYLVSARTVEVPFFTEAETRLLLTQPLKYSEMWERDDPKRPRFDAAFWGDGGIERIHAESAGWPHLVQLIAETTVDLLNDTNEREVSAALFERALDQAVVRGDIVLRQLMEGECSLPGEWDYLRAFRTRDVQALPGDEGVYRSLRRRLLVCDVGGDWRLRAPLMQRWLRARG